MSVEQREVHFISLVEEHNTLYAEYIADEGEEVLRIGIVGEKHNAGMDITVDFAMKLADLLDRFVYGGCAGIPVAGNLDDSGGVDAEQSALYEEAVDGDADK